MSLKTLILGSGSDFVERAPPRSLARFFSLLCAPENSFFFFPFERSPRELSAIIINNSLLVHFEFTSVFALQLHVLV